MAKKKIADVATENDLSPKELLKQLQEAGFSVSSPTSTIDDGLAKKVLGLGKPGTAGGNGAAKAQEAPAPPRQPRKAQTAGSQLRAKPRQGGTTAPRTPPKEQRPQRDERRGEGGGRGQPGGGGRPEGPTRDDQRTGGRAPNAGGAPRRVVIDSQASRRQDGPG